MGTWDVWCDASVQDHPGHHKLQCIDQLLWLLVDGWVLPKILRPVRQGWTTHGFLLDYPWVSVFALMYFEGSEPLWWIASQPGIRLIWEVCPMAEFPGTFGDDATLESSSQHHQLQCNDQLLWKSRTMAEACSACSHGICQCQWKLPIQMSSTFF